MWDHLRRMLPALGEAGLLTFLVKTGRAADMQATINKKEVIFQNRICFSHRVVLISIVSCLDETYCLLSLACVHICMYIHLDTSKG